MTRRYWISEESVGPLAVAVDRLDAEGSVALDEGRVFVNRRRARRGDSVALGDQVEVHPARPEAPGVRVLAEQAGAVLAWKPSGLPTEPDHRGDASLVAAIAQMRHRPPGSVHAVTRLDLEVSGVVVVALDRGARRSLTAAQRAGRVERTYLGVAVGAPEPSTGRWDEPIQDRSGRPRPAATRFRVLAQVAAPAKIGQEELKRETKPALLALFPETGRTHQIRIHCARAQLPLLGDRRYGGPVRLGLAGGQVVAARRLALHAHRVRVGDLCATAPEPVDLVELWVQLGGDAQAFACV